MNTETVVPTARIERRAYAVVRPDGAVALTEEEVRHVGAGAALEVARIPQGLALVSEDVGPQKIYLEITTACDLGCAMCVHRSWQEPGGSMSADTFGGLLEQLRDLPSVETINLSGYGEPMAHPLFYEFVSQAKQARLCVEVVTNGTRLGREAAERLIDLKLDKLIVSVDGISPASTRMLHAGSFARVAKNLQTLYRRRLARGAARPDVGIEFVATRRNIHELPELESLARVLGFSSILVTNLIPHTPELAEDTLYERWSTTSRPRRASPWSPWVDLPLMDARSPASAVVERLRGGGARLRVNGTELVGAGSRCRFVTEGRLAIRWDGSISPCLPLMHTHTYYFRGKPKHIRRCHLGNVNDTPLADIWAGEPYRTLRDRVRKFEFSPCIDCGGCDLRETNEEDCLGNVFPCCGECLWAAGLVQCP